MWQYVVLFQPGKHIEVNQVVSGGGEVENRRTEASNLDSRMKHFTKPADLFHMSIRERAHRETFGKGRPLKKIKNLEVDWTNLHI